MNGFNLANISEVYYEQNKCRQIIYEGNQIFPSYTDPNYTTDFTITALDNGTTIYIYVNNTTNSNCTFFYKTKFNDYDWYDESFVAEANTAQDYIPTVLLAGQTLKIRGSRGSSFDQWGDNLIECKIHSTGGRFTVSGNLLSLIYGYNYGDDFYKHWTDTLPDGVFSDLFYNNQDIISAENLIINSVSKLSHSGMFMFCHNLTTGPKLVAPVLHQQCYDSIFVSCDNLNTVYMLADDIDANWCLHYWLYNTTGGVIYKKATTTIPSGDIPSGWTTQNI